ncbi:hypothetical protein [Alkalihalobacillus trypoxylicola]|uniref:Uncharacterized protein n=1 Tax=Alkalihalobacillus trypoxylicola TaxID=519424 RepID=A0A161P6R6_9BACI|nr:hypothetical protein [Alkalihalobacillus trypoxylicola]KYG26066.1 hypothetical protein AZF04_13350 [Alkalihalobacillus trypoxylicola]
MLKLFFKNSNKVNKSSVNIAFQSTFIFWAITLLINGLFEIIQKKPLINSSLTILLVGLAIFFISEQIVNYRIKKT